MSHSHFVIFSGVLLMTKSFFNDSSTISSLYGFKLSSGITNCWKTFLSKKKNQQFEGVFLASPFPPFYSSTNNGLSQLLFIQKSLPTSSVSFGQKRCMNFFLLLYFSIQMNADLRQFYSFLHLCLWVLTLHVHLFTTLHVWFP